MKEQKLPTLKAAVDEFEKHYILLILDAVDGDVFAAAAVAGVKFSTVYRILREHGIKRDPVTKQFPMPN